MALRKRNNNSSSNNSANVTPLMLDFSEIPPPLLPSIDRDAFEKFAKQYFEEVEGAKVWKTVGRGPDGGVDLIIIQDGMRKLVSCKHPFKTKSVPRDKEHDPYGRMDAESCTGFICFYAGIPSGPLITYFDGIRRRHPDFQPRILNERDIERGLLSYQNAAGWLLAARWFPRSYSKLFSQLVHPIQHYNEVDIAVDGDREMIRLDNGATISYAAVDGNDRERRQGRSTMLSLANEGKSIEAFDSIFLSRIGELANLYPGSFVRARYAQRNSSNEIFPSWDFRYLAELLCTGECSLKNIHSLCIAWSLWNKARAEKIMRAIEVMYWMNWKQEDGLPTTIEDVQEEYGRRNDGQDMFSNVHTVYDLSYHALSSLAPTLERGYFAGLLCFSPSFLSDHPNPHGIIVRLARHYEELELLRTRLGLLTDLCDRFDKEYVSHRAGTLVDHLNALNFAKSISEEDWFLVKKDLKCFEEPHTEPWMPKVSMSPELAGIMRRRCVPIE
ncbi:restriction endonuclease [Duganella sp. FT3S]|uniref:Restriction endonuclease n=1 Tax=Rugamonas fusca TaxID=2758568 RepID=A0A7W2I7T9_9BURK|nr:restriction endonuclease [Rugamonas fusca]MBA5606799.1 restriction endonuclease [Rugamonas fusca]